jgi:arylsulfatase
MGFTPWAKAPYRDGDNNENEIINVGDDFYSTRFYTQRMIDYIEKDRADDRPFFAYLAYTAPHWPLQAPKESIAKFKGWYDGGYEAIYQQRFKKMQALGLITEDAEMFDDSVWSRRWNDLGAEEKKISSRKMEIYAAMVSDLDTYVGQFIDYLKEIGEYENTFIIFSSDNGAHPNPGGFGFWIKQCCDNSYDNLGSATSYVLYGPDWATASTVAHRRHKATAFEGGIQVPAFARYPKFIEAGTVSDGFSTVMDLMPTFLELAEHEHPGTSYNGYDILPVKGRSLIPLLRGNATAIHPDSEYTGWELYGHRAVRQGNWKITWDARQGPNAKWMLFNLADDPAEQNDLSHSNPQKLSEMMNLWDRYAEENGLVF